MTTFNDMTAAELREFIAEHDEEQAELFARAKCKTMIKWIEENIDLEDEEGEEEGSKMANHIRKYREGYHRSVSYTGRKSLYNGDHIAIVLEGAMPMTAIIVAEVICNLEIGTLANKYANLNPGQRRMNAGNRIRGALKRGEITMAEIEAAFAKFVS